MNSSSSAQVPTSVPVHVGNDGDDDHADKNMMTMKRVLKVDARERSLLEALLSSDSSRQHDFEAEIENLDLGDIQVVTSIVVTAKVHDASHDQASTAAPPPDAVLHESSTYDVIIERKTLADMCASIKDGRYREQKHRVLGHLMQQQDRRAHVFYVLEGVSSFESLAQASAGAGLNPSTLHSCIFNMMIRDGIHVVFTKDVQDTACFVKELWLRRKKMDSENAQPNANAHSESRSRVDASACLISSSVHAKRGKNLTPATCYAMQLCQIPGVSEKTAQVISQRWPSMRAMFKEMEPLENADRVSLLTSLPAMGKKNAQRFLDHMFPAVQ